MRKPTNDFFKILTEAIKLRNSYGTDFESERETQRFIPIIGEKPDYSYHGITKRQNIFKGETETFFKEKGISEKISDRLKIKRDIKKLEAKDDQPELFTGVKEIEKARLATLQNDFKTLSVEIDEIKKDKNAKTYSKFLRRILTDFFMVPGGKMAKRYVFLPLKRNFTQNDINALNKTSSLDKNLLGDLNNKKDITISFSSDVKIRQFLRKYGYSFKDEVKDFYSNICYTKNNAMVKITDELKKIENINLIEKEKALSKIKDITKIDFVQSDIDKRKEYSEDFLKRMEAIEAEIVDVDNPENIPVVVITWVPRMIMSQSTTTIWKSCMELSNERSQVGGINKKYVATGIENGVFIAWLVNMGDAKTIDNPIARILIKPYMDEEVFVWLPSRMYFDGSEGNNLKVFQQVVGKFCFNKQRKAIRSLEKSKINIEVNVKRDKIYQDDGDHNKKIVTMKRAFNHIIKDYQYDNDFYRTVDFSTNKALAYLKALKDDFIINNQPKISRILSLSLLNQDLTIFNYLANRNEELTKSKEITKKAIIFLFDFINNNLRNEDSNIKHSFFNYIFKYYSQHLDEYNTNAFFIKQLDNHSSHMLDTAMQNEDFVMKAFHNMKDFHKFDLLSRFIGYNNLYGFKTSSSNLKNIETLLKHLINKNMTSVVFNLSQAKDVDALMKAVNVMNWFDFNYNNFDKKLQKLVDTFLKEIEKTINIEYIKQYVSINKTNVINSGKNKNFLRIKNNFLKYGKTIKEKYVKVNYFNFLAGIAKENNFERDIAAKENDLDHDVYAFLFDNFTDEVYLKNSDNLYIIFMFEQKEFEQRLDKFLAQFDTQERQNMLSYLLNYVFKEKFIFIYETKAHDKFQSIENKIKYVLDRYSKEIEKNNFKIADVLNNIYKFNKNFLSLLSNFFIFDKKQFFHDYLLRELNYRKYSNTIEDANVFVNNLKIIEELFKIKKLKIEPKDGILAFFFRYHDLMFNFDNKPLQIINSTIREICDFSDIIDDIVNGETNKESYSRNNLDFVFDLNDNQILNAVFKNKNIYKNEHYVFKLFFRGTRHITDKIDNLKSLNISKENFIDNHSKVFKNVRFIFKNDYHYAMKLALADIKTYDRDRFYKSIIILNMIFNIDEDEFYKTDYFKQIIIENGLNIRMFDQQKIKKDSFINFKRYALSIPELTYDEKTRMEMKFIDNVISNDYKNKNHDISIKEIEQQFLDIDYHSIDSKNKNELINSRLHLIFRNFEFRDIKRLDKIIDKAIELVDQIRFNKHVDNYETFFILLRTLGNFLKDIDKFKNDQNKKEFERNYPLYLKYANAIIIKYVKYYLRNFDIKEVKQEKTDKPNDISIILVFNKKDEKEMKEVEEYLNKNLRTILYGIDFKIKSVLEA